MRKLSSEVLSNLFMERPLAGTKLPTYNCLALGKVSFGLNIGSNPQTSSPAHFKLLRTVKSLRLPCFQPNKITVMVSWFLAEDIRLLGHKELTAAAGARVSAFIRFPWAPLPLEHCKEGQIIFAQWVTFQERNSELRKLASFIRYSKHTCSLLQKKTVSLSSTDDHYTNIPEKIVWNKGNQFPFVREACKNTSHANTCIVSYHKCCSGHRVNTSSHKDLIIS